MSQSLENDEICRTCLSRNKGMTCVFSTHDFEHGATRICDVILSFASVQIQEQDGLPQQMCTWCIVEMKRAFAFRRLCEKSDDVLRHKLNSTQNIKQLIKIEPENYPENNSTGEIYNSEFEYVNIDFKVDVSDSQVTKHDPIRSNTNSSDDQDSVTEQSSCENNNTDKYDNDDKAKISLKRSEPTVIPNKSLSRYEKQYSVFCDWRKECKVRCVDETVMLTYFVDASKKFNSSTLWAKYSMLKSTLLINENVDISKFHKLKAFLKKQAVGHQSNKSKVFTREEINKFMKEAPNEDYLLAKVVAILGIAGGCRRDELYNLSIDDMEDTGYQLVVTIGPRRVFTVTNGSDGLNSLDLYRKYRSLRPTSLGARALFMLYRQGKCISQRVGIHTIGGVPKRIAEYLELEHPERYTGHCFRRTSATLVANARAD